MNAEQEALELSSETDDHIVNREKSGGVVWPSSPVAHPTTKKISLDFAGLN